VTPVLTALEDLATPLLKDRIRTLYRHLPKALSGQEEPIHQMRVAGRRLRVALPLLTRKPEGRRVRRALSVLRQLVRAAGRSRDLDVSLALFQKHVPRQASEPPELTLIRRRLRAARSRSWKRMAEGLLDLELASLRRDLKIILSRKAEEPFTILVRLRRARDVGGALLLAAIETVGDRFEPAELHRIRRRSRRLRYVAEVNAHLRGESPDAARRLKELQERLGQVHDACILAGWFGQQAASNDRRGRAALAAEARKWEAEFMNVGRSQHRSFLEELPGTIVQRALSLMGRSGIATSA